MTYDNPENEYASDDDKDDWRDSSVAAIGKTGQDWDSTQDNEEPARPSVKRIKLAFRATDQAKEDAHAHDQHMRVANALLTHANFCLISPCVDALVQKRIKQHKLTGGLATAYERAYRRTRAELQTK